MSYHCVNIDLVATRSYKFQTITYVIVDIAIADNQYLRERLH